MEWEKWAQLWGPAVPMFFVFVWYLHKLIVRTMPRGFRSLKEAIIMADARADKRHEEAMAAIRQVDASLVRLFDEHRKRAAGSPARKSK